MELEVYAWPDYSDHASILLVFVDSGRPAWGRHLIGVFEKRSHLVISESHLPLSCYELLSYI